ncbi:type II secretion system F family protein [Actinopolymorpha sp. B17G11]|uniref:type II secretion system F family protein n=1 Tax=Actinopolymorpha sp. B17G11 TaxID=3160861 RepID=UPI0032E3A5E7
MSSYRSLSGTLDRGDCRSRRRSARRRVRQGRRGAPPWQRSAGRVGDLPRRPVLASFGRAMVRVWDSGAPLAVTLERLAADARRTRRARAEQKARAVGVRSAVPLALCFLPAFVLVGVVPLVAGAVSGLLR